MRQVFPPSCWVILLEVRAACLSWDLELLRAITEQTINASNSNKKNSSLYIYSAFTISSPAVFNSRTRSLRGDLRGRRLPLWSEGGREVRRKGRGTHSSPPVGCPRAGCTRRDLLRGNRWGLGAAARAAQPKLTLFCHLVPRVQIARARCRPHQSRIAQLSKNAVLWPG